MSELSALRAEIKGWERDFKAKNDRDASIQDIKDLPAIAEKYKLYKRLSKAAAAAAVFSNLSQLTQSVGPPSTPPRTHRPDFRPSVIRSNKRIIEPSGPLSSFNPFSPVKNNKKRTQRDSFRSPNLIPHARSNPFTPPKAITKRVENAVPSIDPFPEIQPSPSKVPETKTKPPNDALSRARKRLRGEPVSPSPIKEKRLRINSQPSLSLPAFASHSIGSDDDENPEDEDTANSSFVNDSPVKRPSGSKSFKLLFDEAVTQNMMPKSDRGKLSRSKATSAASGLFSNSSYKMTNSLFSRATDIDGRQQERGALSKKLTNPRSGDTRHAEKLSSEGNDPGGVGHATPSRNDEPRRAGKRSLADSETVTTGIEPGMFNLGRLPLLPPSPPPVDPSSSRLRTKMNEKNMSRKKAKVLEEIEDGDRESSEDYAVKLVDRALGKPIGSNENDVYFDSDMLIFAPGRSGVDIPHVIGPEDHVDDVQVNLPERLRHVLAISPPRARDRKEEQVICGLLHGGGRVARYDPRRGGEIWEVGEGGDDFLGDTEGENDWEAEPVPWEIGEL